MMHKALLLLLAFSALASIIPFAFAQNGPGRVCYVPKKCESSSDCHMPSGYTMVSGLQYQCIDHRCEKKKVVNRKLGESCGQRFDTYFHCIEGHCDDNAGVCKAVSGHKCDAPKTTNDLWTCSGFTKDDKCMVSRMSDYKQKCDNDDFLGCPSSLQCNSNSCEAAVSLGGTCFSHDACGPEAFCDFNANNGAICVSRRSADQGCDSSEQCHFKYNCIDKKCVAPFTVEENSNCTRHEDCNVDNGLVCDLRYLDNSKQIYNGFCTKYEKKTCHRSMDCPTLSCGCESIGRDADSAPKAKCLLSDYEHLDYLTSFSHVKKYYKPLFECMKDNKCYTEKCDACVDKYVEYKCKYSNKLAPIVDGGITFDCKKKTIKYDDCEVLKSKK